MAKKLFSGFIVILLILCAGYVIYVRYIDVPPVEEVKVEEENLNDIDTNLVNFIEDNQIRRLISIKKYPTNLIFSNAMFDSDMILWVLDKSCLPLRECVSVGTDELDYDFEKVFNLKNVAYNDYTCKADNTLLYSYDNNTYKVAGVVHEHDKTYNYVEPIYTKIDSINKVGKDYILTLYELYYDLNNNSFISADPLGEVKIFDPKDYITASLEINTTKIITDYENTFEENKANYPVYKYTFRKNEDNFYLYKFEH